MKELAALLDMSPRTAGRVAEELAATGWIVMTMGSRGKRPAFCVPHCHQKLMIEDLNKRYELTSNKAEWLVKQYLNFRILSTEFVENARPVWLTTPGSEEPMEYDRIYYRLGLAVEYNGQQHYQTTQKYPDKAQLKQQKDRDVAKVGHSKNHGIDLIVVTCETLMPEEMEKKIGNVIKERAARQAEVPEIRLNPVLDTGPYYSAIVNLCKGYQETAKRGS